MKTDIRPGSLSDQTRSGFTLIELLVVIAIIAILAAILFPVFAKVREKARQTQCLSNMKQINLGMLQYVEDNDEAWPAAEVSLGAAGTNAGGFYGARTTQASWAYVIYPYVKSKAVYICPDDQDPVIDSADFPGANPQDIVRTYIPVMQYNEDGAGPKPDNESAIMINGHDNTAGPKNMTDSQIPYPASTIWLTEAGSNTNLATGQCWGGANPCPNTNLNQVGLFVFQRATFEQPNGGSRNQVANYHTGGTNWCFGDGHVHWSQINQTINTSDYTKDLWCRLKD